MSLRELDESAFDGCNNIRNIRISEDNPVFYVSEQDGCLYERTDSGDKLRLKVLGAKPQQVSLFNENVDEEEDPETELFFTDEDFYEEDDDFSAEIPAGDEDEAEAEVEAEVETEPEAEPDLLDREIAAASGLETVQEEITQDTVDDIMPEPAREEKDNGASVSNDELAKLFGGPAPEQEEPDVAVTVKFSDSKTQAIMDSVDFYKVIDCKPKGTPPADADLFVIAEMLAGKKKTAKKAFTKKLEAVSKKFAKIQDYKRIFMLYGLPVDNDEFMEFYKLYVSNRNVVFACEAESPSTLSDYGKKICEYSRISLAHEDLLEQKRNISTKGDTLIKLIIRDIK